MDDGDISSVGAVFLFRSDGAVLLQLRDVKPGLPRAGMWVVPGGHRDPGEPMHVCARREFREETDYDCHQLRFLYRIVDINDVAGPYHLYLYWDDFDGLSPYRCQEGQLLWFVRRDRAARLDIPHNLLEAWDALLDLRAGIAPIRNAEAA
jgi:8-oxo-dGTP pyrophosphatase MutT (NUDIX family)